MPRASRREPRRALLEAEREADATRVRAIQEAREESATIRREAEEDVRARREEISRLGEPHPGVRDGAPEAGHDDRVADHRTAGARREAPVRAGAAREGGGSASGRARADREHDLGRGQGAPHVAGRGGRQARGHDPGPRDRATSAGGGRRARAEDRDDRHPARGLRADGRIHGLGVRRCRART